MLSFGNMIMCDQFEICKKNIFQLSPCDGRKADKMAAMRKRTRSDWKRFHTMITQWKMNFELPFSTHV